MPCPTLQDYLEDNEVDWEILPHPTAYTAQETAARLHTHGWEIAKPTMLMVDGELVMAVLPAPSYVDIETMKEVTGAEEIRLALEEEFESVFHDCEPGAEPPFGNLYGIETYIDEELASSEHVTFDAGNHREAIRMRMDDFEDLCEGIWARFSSSRRLGEPEIGRPEARRESRPSELSPEDL